MRLNKIELKDFIYLSNEEVMMVLDWRNNENIRKWMYDSDCIPKKNHLKFIESLKKNEMKKYFLVLREEKYIGVIYFINIDDGNSTEFGLYSNPDIKIPGIGRVLEKICIEYAFDILKVKKLKLEVFEDNKQVINLHRKFNFKEVSTMVMNNKKVLCMELKNEDRQF